MADPSQDASAVSPTAVTLNVDEYGDMSKLAPIFDQFQNAMIEQKGKISSYWINHNSKSVSIDIAHTLQYISNIGNNKTSFTKQEENALSILYQIISKFKDYNNNVIETIQNSTSTVKYVSKTTTLNTDSNTPVSSNYANNNNNTSQSGSNTANNTGDSADGAYGTEEIKIDTSILELDDSTADMSVLEDKKAAISKILAQAEPQLKAAKAAVSKIDASALNELLSLHQPPSTVVKVLTVVAYLIDANDDFFEGGSRSRSRSTTPKSPKGAASPRWSTAGSRSPSSRKLSKEASNRKLNKAGTGRADIFKQPWRDTKNFLKAHDLVAQIAAFDVTKLHKNVPKLIETEYLVQEDFDVERANKASKVLGPLVQWIISLVEYSKIWFQVAPSMKKVENLEKRLAMQQLQNKIDNSGHGSKKAESDSDKEENAANGSDASSGPAGITPIDLNADEIKTTGAGVSAGTDDSAITAASDTSATTTKVVDNSEEIAKKVEMINKENEMIDNLLKQLEGELKVTFVTFKEESEASKLQIAKLEAAKIENESKANVNAANEAETALQVKTDDIAEIIKSTMKSVLENNANLINNVNTNVTDVSNENVTNNVESGKDEQQQEKDVTNSLPFNDVVDSIKSIENKLREIKLFNESEEERMSKYFKENEKILNGNISNIDTNLSECETNIMNELKAIQNNNSKNIEMSDSNDEINKSLTSIVESIEKSNEMGKKRSENVLNNILENIESVNNSISELTANINNVSDTVISENEKLQSSIKENALEVSKQMEAKEEERERAVIQNEANQSSNDGNDNNNVTNEKIDELMKEAIALNGKNLKETQNSVIARIEEVNDKYNQKLNETMDSRNELLQQYVREQVNEMKAQLETLIASVMEAIGSVSNDLAQTKTASEQVKKDMAMISEKLSSLQFEQQLVRQQQAEQAEKRQEFLKTLEDQQKQFLLQQAQLLEQQREELQEMQQSNQNSQQSQGQSGGKQYKTLSEAEDSPLIDGSPKELAPKAYVLAKDWCCGVVCCFQYACGTAGNCCRQ